MSKTTDKREDYVYSLDSYGIRPEYKYIVDWIENGSKVLDMGCGNGLSTAVIGISMKGWICSWRSFEGR